MTSNEDKFLQLCRAKIAATRTLHKVMAYKCGVSRSTFSQCINGDVVMPERIRIRLIKLLRLEPILEKLAKNNNE